jgi:hypothetical protein
VAAKTIAPKIDRLISILLRVCNQNFRVMLNPR